MPGPTRRYPLYIAAIALLLIGTAVQGDERPSEYQVRAAYLYNFAKFVEWPNEAEGDTTSNLVIGILEPDPFGETMDRTVEGKTVRGRELEIRRSAKISDLARCHILFLGSVSPDRAKQLLSRLGTSPVLTVSEGEGFLEVGGMVSFILDDETIRFKVNLEATHQARLKMSSKLLRVAVEVIGG